MATADGAGGANRVAPSAESRARFRPIRQGDCRLIASTAAPSETGETTEAGVRRASASQRADGAILVVGVGQVRVDASVHRRAGPPVRRAGPRSGSRIPTVAHPRAIARLGASRRRSNGFNSATGRGAGAVPAPGWAVARMCIVHLGAAALRCKAAIQIGGPALEATAGRAGTTEAVPEGTGRRAGSIPIARGQPALADTALRGARVALSGVKASTAASAVRAGQVGRARSALTYATGRRGKPQAVGVAGVVGVRTRVGTHTTSWTRSTTLLSLSGYLT